MQTKAFAKWTMIAGATIVVVTLWGATHFVPPFYTHTYPFAWYGLIFFLDGLLWSRWNEGFIFKRPGSFATLLFWSAVFWFYFELWNLRLQNWYYAGVSSQGLWAHAEAYMDFATVLPGIFLVYRLLCRLKIPHQVQTSIRLSKQARAWFFPAGVAMIFLPAAFPDIFFPMVWGCLIFLLEPFCAKFGAPSLVRNAEQGHWTTFVRLLLAGLICGGYWEFWNHLSLEKWVYTVPFFSQGKLFEMPYPGFLGFPPFAVECFVMANAVFLVRGKRHWTPNTPGIGHLESFPRLAYVAMMVAGVLLSEISYSQMKKNTVDSHAQDIYSMLEDISAADARRLAETGWHYPAQILIAWDRSCLLIAQPFRVAVKNRLELASLLQMGAKNARLLEKAGVGSRETLARQDPGQLFAVLTAINTAEQIRKSPLLKRRIKAWIYGARRTSTLY
ncbi:MAG: DUF4332 domain-containing protein [Deltaproteobacteria bacterium]|nr:DUF4332 domain-containing protein [Deltaproteobacteria bacterium]